MTITDRIGAFIDREFAREAAFLAELVKVPSDNPPGDCAPHAARAKELLEGLGFTVEAHPFGPGAQSWSTAEPINPPFTPVMRV